MTNILNLIKKIPWWAKNIYFLVVAFFVVWMLFFDRNSLLNTYEFNQRLSTLKKQKVYYQNEIEKVDKLKEELFSTDEKKEKFAREKYFMKKKNEDVFIVVEKENK